MEKNYFAMLQELESDDELPDTYKDISILPAYLDDCRFEEIKFPWMDHSNLKWVEPKIKTHIGRQYDVMLHRNGVLKGQDLYCLKSVESCICSTTLIWFVNFLLHKDLQSHYTYLRSCLVSDIISVIPITRTKSEDTVPNDRYEIIIKV